MKKVINETRVVAVVVCSFTGKISHREVNVPSSSFGTELAADAYVMRQLENWISERGNDQHETVLELGDWYAFPTSGDVSHIN